MSTATYANPGGVPLALAVFLATDQYDGNPDPMTISATTLMKPIRQIVLPHRIDTTGAMVDLASQMSNRLGTAIHNGIENAWVTNYKQAMRAIGLPQPVIDRVRINPTPEELQANPRIIPIYMEQRAKKIVGRWTVTGKFDFIGDGKVQDFKTASIWSYMNQVNADKQTLQGSLYRWLLPDKITKDTMEIHHIFMDWRASMVKSDPKYPPQRFATQAFRLRPVEDIQKYVVHKLQLVDKYWNAPEAEIPLCDDEDLWLTESKFKFYANGDINSLKSTKNFDTAADAQLHMATVGKGAVKEVKGQVRACLFCSGFMGCSQKDDLIKSGRLIVV